MTLSPGEWRTLRQWLLGFAAGRQAGGGGGEERDRRGRRRRREREDVLAPLSDVY